SLFILAIGFIGGGKRFRKGSGTGAGVCGFLAGIGAIISGAGLLRVLGTMIIEEATRALLSSALGLIVCGIFGFLFGILALVYFFGSPKGWLGGIGGLLAFIGIIASIRIPQLYYLSGIGTIMMGISFLLQSRAAEVIPAAPAPTVPVAPAPPMAPRSREQMLRRAVKIRTLTCLALTIIFFITGIGSMMLPWVTAYKREGDWHWTIYMLPGGSEAHGYQDGIKMEFDIYGYGGLEYLGGLIWVLSLAAGCFTVLGLSRGAGRLERLLPVCFLALFTVMGLIYGLFLMAGAGVFMGIYRPSGALLGEYKHLKMSKVWASVDELSVGPGFVIYLVGNSLMLLISLICLAKLRRLGYLS
ncbi:MAG: hypothetical protein DRJ69_02705, partial [Thermoprotei archaeon]